MVMEARKRRRASHILAKYSGPSYSDLPRIIVENFLLRLSVKRIFVCKCVCKTWYDLISDPEFAKLHFNQAQVYPLIQTSRFTFLSRMLYLVQPEKDEFELKLDCCHNSPEHKAGWACNVMVKLDTKFKLPLRNLQTILNDDDDIEFNTNFLKLNMKNHKYKVANSCNGLLCLIHPSDRKPLIVCNPVTGEFINLPEETAVKQNIISCGLGFSPVTNQYKTVRIFTFWIKDAFSPEGRSGMFAQVHTLGTKSWKNVGAFRFSVSIFFPTYSNGNLYWYNFFASCMVFFDLEKDCFGLFSPPPFESPFGSDNWSIGLLGGELCMSEFLANDRIDFWVVKDFDREKGWSKIVSIDMKGNGRWPRGMYQPVKYLNNGALLMYISHKSAFVYYDPKKRGFRYLKMRGMLSKAEVIGHIPSFVSLKDAVSGLNTTVLNVNYRCGKLKLHNESKGISIVERIRELEMDSE